ncbi:MAG: membrane protein insertase YidC [Proteobacteria bacterium]|nr:membrane protein insertase YidC [Pseudomonadota bacterium]MBU1610231.1 membrane protein insertase YidC [Pseudomonadota bacterium]
METKRLILALVLTFAVFFGWQYFFPPAKVPAPTTEQTSPAQSASQAATSTTTSSAPVAAGEIVASEGKSVTITTPLYTAVFNTQGGLMESFKLTNYYKSIKPDAVTGVRERIDMVSAPTLGLSIGAVNTWTSAEWDAAASDASLEQGEHSLTFTGRADGYLIQRTLTFKADNYTIAEDVRVTSETATSDAMTLGVSAGTNVLADAENMYNQTQIAWLDAAGIDSETDAEDLAEEGLPVVPDVNWGGVENNYFLLAVQPAAAKNTLSGGVHDETSYFIRLDTVDGSIKSGETKTFQNIYFVGPKERDLLAAASEELAKAVYFGWSSFVAEPLLWFLVWVDQFIGNYGISIIILTILIKLIFWPLSQKSYKSMEQMKRLQPMIQKLREKHGTDKQTLNTETMQLYKTYKVNPAGGCLPMVVQIPVFFGLYRALLGAVELRHAGFIDFVPFTDITWLADLSAKDPFYVTPVVMGLTMLGQQLMSPSAGDPTQRKMMLLMPVVFTFLFLQFPAGLVIYWMVNNVLSIAQQWMIGRSAKTSKA